MENQEPESSRGPEEGARAVSEGPRESDPVSEVRSPAERAVLLGRLAAGLAHEIKNPLSTMAINLALLEEEWARAAQSRDPDRPEPTARERRCLKRVQTLQREVRRLETITDDFLHYARGGEINRAPRDIVAIVRELVDFVDAEDSRQAIAHHVVLPPKLPMVMLDESAVKQAILNLLVNARQAMPEGGELMVTLERKGNYAQLTITDTGVGMTEEQLERCFDEYFSTKKGGTGLGLATVRRTIEEHEGTIRVLSEPGRGTSFTIALPLLVELYGSGGERGGVLDVSGEPVASARGRSEASEETATDSLEEPE